MAAAVAAGQALEHGGLPEAQLNLAHAVVYLATAPKSNRAYAALHLWESLSAEPSLPATGSRQIA